MRPSILLLTLAASVPLASVASAAAPAVDVVVTDAPPPRRVLVLELNPLALILGKLSLNAVIAPVDHHSLVISPFLASTTTAPIYVYDPAGNATQAPQQKFQGFGAELGYRYYSGVGGPRGFFLGPSLVLGAFQATAQNGTDTGYLAFGLAADVGYQALVLDRLSLALGVGVQVNGMSKSIPSQQFPADVYANSGVRPRMLASIGYAF